MAVPVMRRRKDIAVYAAFLALLAMSAEGAQAAPLQQVPMCGGQRVSVKQAEVSQELLGLAKGFGRPDDVQAGIQIAAGWKALSESKFEIALSNFNLAYGLDPKQGESCAGMGAVLMAAGGDQAEAEELFKLAAASKSPTSVVYQNYGLFLIHNGRFAEANGQLSKGLDIEPDAYVMRMLRAAARDKIGQSEQGTEDMKMACGDAARLRTYKGRPEEAGMRETCSSLGVPLP